MYLTDTPHRVAAFGPQKKTTKTKPKQRSNMFKCSLAENVTAHAGTHSTLYLPLSPFLVYLSSIQLFFHSISIVVKQTKRNELRQTKPKCYENWRTAFAIFDAHFCMFLLFLFLCLLMWGRLTTTPLKIYDNCINIFQFSPHIEGWLLCVCVV